MAENLNLSELTYMSFANDFDSETTDLKQLADNNVKGLSWNIPKLPHDKDFHLFICYIQDNSGEARAIAEDLEREGLKCCYHERDFLPGQQVIGNIHVAIKRSVSTLVILSEKFVQSKFCLHEIEQALHAMISEGYRIIPLKIEPCVVPELLKNITYIDAEMIPAREMYVKILDAFVWNDWHREQNVESNGFTLDFPLSKYKIGMVGCRCLSIWRFKLVFDDEKRNTIRRNNFEISDGPLHELETMMSNSVHVKYAHIIRLFILLTTLIFVMEGLLVTGILFLIAGFNLSPTQNGMHINVISSAFDYNILTVFILWICLVCVHGIGISGILKSWKGMTYGVQERSKNRLKREIWKKINSRYAEANKLIISFQDMKLLMLRYDFKPCKDLFVRRCDSNETMKKNMLPEESLQAYAQRLFRNYIESNVEMLFVPSRSFGRHKMVNDAKCLCLLVEESILKDEK